MLCKRTFCIWLFCMLLPMVLLVEPSHVSFAHAASYNFTPIYTGEGDCYVKGINDQGQVVGSYDSGRHAFLFDGVSFKTLDVPGATHTTAHGINSLGNIVGYYVDESGTTHGFLYNGTSFDVIDPPGALHTYVYGVNDFDIMVGIYYDGTWHSFRFDGATFSNVDMPNSSRSFAFDINNNGKVLGTYYVGTDRYIYTYDGLTYNTIAAPLGSLAYGINDSDKIVGCLEDSLGKHILLIEGTEITKLDLPNAIGSIGMDINNYDDLAGWYSPKLSAPAPIAGFIACPVPLPDSIWLLGSGLIGLLGFTKKRRK